MSLPWFSFLVWDICGWSGSGFITPRARWLEENGDVDDDDDDDYDDDDYDDDVKEKEEEQKYVYYVMITWLQYGLKLTPNTNDVAIVKFLPPIQCDKHDTFGYPDSTHTSCKF